MKEHEKRELVNAITVIAKQYGATQQLRERIAHCVLPAIEAAASDEREACAALCEEVVTHPAGHGGAWEGYGPIKAQRDGKTCAAAIRERSNA